MGGSGVGVGVVGRPISNLKTHYSKLNLSAWTCCRGARGSRYVSCGSEFVERARARVRLQANCEEVMSLLQADLPRLFEEEGIDQDMYEKNVQFRDPITKHDTLQGYLFNIRLLRLLFRPLFLLHSLRQTGPNEITTRWTMVMTFGLLPWKPQLVFTGTSVMGLNPQTGKFCSHVDYWDSIKQNDYFSFEGFMDVVKQLCILKTPDLETPKYWILKRTADYEVFKPRHGGMIHFLCKTLVRKYESFVVIETKCDKLTGLSGFDNVIGYIFGKNTKEEKIPMTTPIFTQTMDPSQVHIQLVLPLESTILELPEPLLEGLQLRRIQENIVAVAKLSDKATEKIVYEKEKDLRASLIRDGIQPKPGCMLARYNDPNSTWNFIMRNEVLICLDTFVLD